ncbi:uncharacterized protein LOC119076104 isoform X2 [Bradysia coprophila]|nr:uncharacterized protein LOC119076104 isoform X2 [Bradysia coprophila]
MQQVQSQFSETAVEYLREMTQKLISDPNLIAGIFAKKKINPSIVAQVESLMDEANALKELNQRPDMSDVIGPDEYDSEAEVTEYTDKDLLKKNDKKMFYQSGGSYRHVRDALAPTLEVLEVNHMPPNAAYIGTKYAKIHKVHRPAISMHKRHHRNLPSTFNSDEYSTLLRKIMKKSFSHTLVAEIGILWLHKLINECFASVKQLMKYCRWGHEYHPREAKGVFREPLINGEEYLYLQDVLEEMIENQFNGTNFNLLEKWIPADATDRDELLDFLKRVPENHLVKRGKHADAKSTLSAHQKKRVRKRKRIFSVAKRSSKNKCSKTE